MSSKRTKIAMYTDFMTGLNDMIDASSQLVHQFGNLKWMAFRDMLHMVKDDTVKHIKEDCR